MPCVAKKHEARRPEHCLEDGVPLTDAVLTTRELIWMIQCYGIDFRTLPDGEFDAPLGIASGAGDIFGTTGGVMEATLRAAAELVTGKPADRLEFTEVRAVEGLRDTYVAIGERNLHVGVANGLTNAKILLEKIRSGEESFHVVEVMACPGGCIGGGGQPYPPEGFVGSRSRAAAEAGRGPLRHRPRQDPPQILRKSRAGRVVRHVPRRAGLGKGPSTPPHPLSSQTAARNPMSMVADNWEAVQSQARAALGEDVVALIEQCRGRPNPESQLIAVLHRVQGQRGWLAAEQLDAVAQLLQVPAATVAGVASFYHFFRLQPRGRFMIDVCLGTACYVKGGDRIAEKIMDELGIRWGETTKDGVFTLEACALRRGLRPGADRGDRRGGPRPGHARPGPGDAGEVSEAGKGGMIPEDAS